MRSYGVLFLFLIKVRIDAPHVDGVTINQTAVHNAFSIDSIHLPQGQRLSRDKADVLLRKDCSVERDKGHARAVDTAAGGDGDQSLLGTADSIGDQSLPWVLAVAGSPVVYSCSDSVKGRALFLKGRSGSYYHGRYAAAAVAVGQRLGSWS